MEPFLQAQHQLNQPFFTGVLLQTTDHFCGLLWTCSSKSISSLYWGPRGECSTPGRALWKQSRWGELPPLAFLPHFFSCTPEYDWFLSNKHTVSGMVIHQQLCPAPPLEGWPQLSKFISPPILKLGFSPAQRQDLALVFVGLNEVHIAPVFTSVWVSPNQILSTRVSNTSVRLVNSINLVSPLNTNPLRLS